MCIHHGIVFLAVDLFLVMDPTCLTLLRGCLKTSYVEAVLDWPHSIKLKVEDRNKFVVVAIGTKASLLKTTKFHSIEYFAKMKHILFSEIRSNTGSNCIDISLLSRS